MAYPFITLFTGRSERLHGTSEAGPEAAGHPFLEGYLARDETSGEKVAEGAKHGHGSASVDHGLQISSTVRWEVMLKEIRYETPMSPTPVIGAKIEFADPIQLLQTSKEIGRAGTEIEVPRGEMFRLR